ncbi:MAG: ECF RNA polymerase sigma factor SigM [Saprospiraceae bacterium]|nr:MAG: ECF RNA polymerase sigma factor SigM [Saprospiraceae bacterium]
MEEKFLPSDEALMHNLRDDQLDCAAMLFERWNKRIYNFFLRLTANAAHSEDLTQLVFERIIRYRHSYQPGYAFKSWIFQIARNQMADQHKQSAFYRDRFVSVEQLKENHIETKTEIDLEKNDQYAQLQKAMLQLSDGYREILVLTRLQQLKYREVAEILGSTEAAVKVKAHRALVQLRNIYFKIEEA